MNNIILVGIDFSECSEHALAQAAYIARKTDSEILMVWIKTFNDKNFGADITNLINIGVESKFNSLKKDYSMMLGASRINYIIEEGNRVYDIIGSIAKRIDPFMVVIGAHGITNNMKEIGSNTYRICQSVSRPVLVVNKNDKDRDIKKIVMPIDSTTETRQKLPITSLLAKNCGAEIHLLAVYTTSGQTIRDRVNSYVAQSVEYLEKNRIKYITTEMSTNNISDSVIKYAVDNQADMISIMDEQETKVVNLWAGSYTEQALNSSPIPILITHMKDTMITMSK